MGEFGNAYRKTLKPRETEEFPNSWIFRPLAFLLIVFPVRKIRFITPNVLTLFSLAFGLLMGFFIFSGYIIPSAIAMLLMVLFDCSDGQLARLTGKSSKIGKILDVSADVVSYFSFFTGAALYMYQHGGSSSVLWLVPLSFVSVMFNVVFYDQFKNQYIRYVYSDYHEKLENTGLLKQQAAESKGCFKKAGLYAYYFFYVLESALVYLGSLPAIKKHRRIFGFDAKIDKEVSARFKKHFFFMTRLWSLIGTGTHYFIMLVILLTVGIKVLLPVFIMYSFGMLGLLLIIQNIVFLSYKE